MRNNDYMTVTLSSGKTVDLRPRTFDEWEKQDDERLTAMEAAQSTGANLPAMVFLQRVERTLRGRRLETCVRDFAARKSVLTLRDVVEIEKHIVSLESEEIPLGNSENGGSGQ